MSGLSASFLNQNNPQYNICNYHYTFSQCLPANLECQVCDEKRYIHKNCLKKGQLGRQQGQNFTLSNIMIEIIQTNIAAIIIKQFSIINKVSASDIFLGIIYTTIPKLLTTAFTLVWILDLDAIRHVSNDQTKFLDLSIYNDSFHTTSEEQLEIKYRRNINLAVRNTVLWLSDALYVFGFIVNLISITKLWRNEIGVYFPTGCLAELSFNGIIFAYADNIKDQSILR